MKLAGRETVSSEGMECEVRVCKLPCPKETTFRLMTRTHEVAKEEGVIQGL